MRMAVRESDALPCGNKHNITFPTIDAAREDAKRRSRQLGQRIGPKYCSSCAVYYVASLVAREMFDSTDIDVLKYLATGLRDHDIAKEMGVHVQIIRKRVSFMFQRTETNSRAQLVALAIHRKLLNYGDLMEKN